MRELTATAAGETATTLCHCKRKMEILDNINRLLGDDMKEVIQPGSKLKVAASCFSIYAFEALKTELEKIGPKSWPKSLSQATTEIY